MLLMITQNINFTNITSVIHLQSPELKKKVKEYLALVSKDGCVACLHGNTPDRIVLLSEHPTLGKCYQNSFAVFSKSGRILTG